MADELVSEIVFPLEPIEGGPSSEVAFAVEVGSNRYRLDNVLYFFYGVSLGDVVEATMENRFLTFRRVLEKSGNRTVRLVADQGQERVAQTILDELVRLRCDYREATPRYIGVNVPPDVELDSVAIYLNSTGLRWEYADPAQD